MSAKGRAGTLPNVAFVEPRFLGAEIGASGDDHVREAKIGLASWTPDSFPGSFRSVIARYVAPPPGSPSPLRWGTDSGVRELLGDGIRALSVTPRTVTQRYASTRHAVEHLMTHFGPVVATFAALDHERQKQLTEDLVRDAERFNRSGDATFLVPLDYLEVVAVRR